MRIRSATAPDFGSMAGTHLVAPMIGIDADRDRQGLLAARRATAASSASATRTFYGSMGGVQLNAPIIAMASTPTGHGYWLLGADGGIFSFGDAVFQGSTGRCRLAAPVVGMATTASGNGLLAPRRRRRRVRVRRRAVHGSIPGTGLCTRPGAVSLTGTNTGHGYWVLTNDGASSRSGTRCTTATRRPTAPGPITLTAVG